MKRRKLPPGTRRFVPRPRFAIPVAILVAGAAVGAWLLTQSTASAGPSYRLVPAARTTLRQTLSSTGTLEPASTSTLSFGAPGQVVLANLSQPLPNDNPTDQGPGFARTIPIVGGGFTFAGQPG